MRIRMKAALVGLRVSEGVAVRWPAAGTELDVPDAEGAHLCANGYAVPVAVVAEPEKRPAPQAAEAAEKRPARRAAK